MVCGALTTAGSACCLGGRAPALVENLFAPGLSRLRKLRNIGVAGRYRGPLLESTGAGS